MNDTYVNYIFYAVLTIGILAGIAMMSRVSSAVRGNALSALCMAAAIAVTMYESGVLSDVTVWIFLALSLAVGLVLTRTAKMIEMPQIVALLNGFGGAASAVVAITTLQYDGETGAFYIITAGLALAVGMLTFTGSMVAAGKLHKLLSQKQVVWPAHQIITMTSAALALISIGAMPFAQAGSGAMTMLVLACLVISGFFGVAFAVRVGGADMPITISLLNSLSGVAGSIAGMAIANPLLVAVGGIVGASGLLLTQSMCAAMNRRLTDILFGSAPVVKTVAEHEDAGGALDHDDVEQARDMALSPEDESAGPEELTEEPKEQHAKRDLTGLLACAKRVFIVPGYGMALAQAQALVKQLADKLEDNGCEVLYAIHPVAGRMPGHMNVLLCEGDVPYEKLNEISEINPQFESCDIAVVIGANDVVNPAANTAEGTPIYGMPILDAYKARHVVVCNYDLQPGYAGVDNPLYKNDNVTLLLGDAKASLKEIIGRL